METMNGYLPELIGFYQVAKLGSFTAAAEEMSLSKAQLSKQVARLETLLRVQLFHRTTRKIALTSEGQRLLKYAEGIVNLSKAALEDMEDFSSSDGGMIRITAPSSLGDWFGPSLLKIFRDEMPFLKVEIDLNNVKRNIVQENYDFALRAMDETDPNLIARYIGHIKDVIVAAPDFQKTNDPEELKNYPALVNSHQQMWNSWKLQKGKKDTVVEVQGNYACSSYGTTKILCLEGMGIARVPFYLVQTELRDKKLIQLCPEYSIATHPLYLVYPSARYKSKRHERAKTLILSWMKAQHEVFLPL